MARHGGRASHRPGHRRAGPPAGETRRLTGLLRRTDTVARPGGDDFVVLVDGVSGPGGDRAVRAGVQAAMIEPHSIDGHVAERRPGVGPAVPGRLPSEVDTAVNRAESAARRR